MDGGTTSISSRTAPTTPLERAREAADGRDVRIGGGANTIQQYLHESLIDELHIAISPIGLGGGGLFEGVDLRALGYECVEFVASEMLRTSCCGTSVLNSVCIFLFRSSLYWF